MEKYQANLLERKRKSRWILKKLIVSAIERYFNDSAIVIVRSIKIIKEDEL